MTVQDTQTMLLAAAYAMSGTVAFAMCQAMRCTWKETGFIVACYWAALTIAFALVGWP